MSLHERTKLINGDLDMSNGLNMIVIFNKNTRKLKIVVSDHIPTGHRIYYVLY